MQEERDAKERQEGEGNKVHATKQVGEVERERGGELQQFRRLQVVWWVLQPSPRHYAKALLQAPADTPIKSTWSFTSANGRRRFAGVLGGCCECDFGR